MAIFPKPSDVQQQCFAVINSNLYSKIQNPMTSSSVCSPGCEHKMQCSFLPNFSYAPDVYLNSHSSYMLATTIATSEVECTIFLVLILLQSVLKHVIGVATPSLYLLNHALEKK